MPACRERLIASREIRAEGGEIRQGLSIRVSDGIQWAWGREVVEKALEAADVAQEPRGVVGRSGFVQSVVEGHDLAGDVAAQGRVQIREVRRARRLRGEGLHGREPAGEHQNAGIVALDPHRFGEIARIEVAAPEQPGSRTDAPLRPVAWIGFELWGSRPGADARLPVPELHRRRGYAGLLGDRGHAEIGVHQQG
ncbi:hypothetical protein GCM10007884_45930 [Methylobacterium brachythecii]|uniref:Uncharacterized protein n=1 Tax=Methylobacterium brachythecii TaxID=1176177 RepID=A0ABQ6D8I6_9HYPH|nr:hypothetical protein GCM10007884_45930 [Methylobacterium brachythecii]